MTVTATPPPTIEIDDGVIEQARRRQRRRWLGFAAVLAGALAVLAGLLIGGGGGARAGRLGGLRFHQRPLHLAFVDGRPYVNGRPFVLNVSPSLQAGNVGVCVMKEGGGGCNGPYAGRAYPCSGRGGRRRPVWDQPERST